MHPHMHRTRSRPGRRDIVVSYGIICHRLRHDVAKDAIVPEYVMVQRKDSICYVEVLRGRYNIFDTTYVQHLFSDMTTRERMTLQSCAFDDMWDMLWLNHNKGGEYAWAKARFEVLKRGISVEIPRVQGGGYTFELDGVCRTIQSAHVEQEWTFPKGRRNHNENNIQCAVREFVEEVGMASDKFQIVDRVPVVLEKMGCNGVLYHTTLFLAKCKPDAHVNVTQCNEVRNVRWMTSASVRGRLHGEQQCAVFDKVHRRVIGMTVQS